METRLKSPLSYRSSGSPQNIFETIGAIETIGTIIWKPGLKLPNNCHAYACCPFSPGMSDDQLPQWWFVFAGQGKANLFVFLQATLDWRQM